MLINSRPFTQPMLTFPEQEQNYVMSGWRASTSQLRTIGASTLILMAAYNPAAQKGIVGHFASLTVPSGHDRKVLDECLTNVLMLGPLGRTSVWIGAGAATRRAEYGHADIYEDRQFMEDQVRAHGLRYTAEWGETDSITSISLHCDVGRLVVRRFEW